MKLLNLQKVVSHSVKFKMYIFFQFLGDKRVLSRLEDSLDYLPSTTIELRRTNDRSHQVPKFMRCKVCQVLSKI